jgi:hypothetical protein
LNETLELLGLNFTDVQFFNQPNVIIHSCQLSEASSPVSTIHSYGSRLD